ncbi:unnamed protein product [Parajaminaea phylloscopi]
MMLDLVRFAEVDLTRASTSVSHILGGLVVLLVVLALIYHDRPMLVPACHVVPQLQPAWPLVGSLPHLATLRRRKIRVLDEMVRQQRTVAPGGKPYTVAVSGKFFGGRVYVVNQPAYIKAVQKDQFETFVKGQAVRRMVGDFLGEKGIFTSDGHTWFTQRKLASHIFAISNFRTQIQSAVHYDLAKLDALCLDAEKRQVQINLPDMFHRFTLEAFIKLAFGVDLDALPETVAGLDHVVEFASCFDYCQNFVERRSLYFLPLWTEIFSEEGRRHRRDVKYLYDFSHQLIEERCQALEQGTAESASKHGKDLLQLFLDAGCPREDLPSIILNFIIAGRDTTAQALSWLMYELWRHPEVATKVRKEVWSIVGKPPQRKLDYEDFKHMPYTNAVFYESIRLHPNVPITRKRASRDTVLRPAMEEATLPAEDLPALVVRKGESVQFSDFVIARMPEVWGEDCESFNPDRFLTETGELKQHSAFLFRAFNSGPRLCLGKNFATYEGLAVIAHLLGKYELVYDDAELRRKPVDFVPALTHPCTPYHVGFRTLAEA